MSRCVLPVLAKRVATQSVILAARRSSRGFLYFLELAVWCTQLMAQSLTVNILGPVREGPSRRQIFPEVDEAGVLWCCLLRNLLIS